MIRTVNIISQLLLKSKVTTISNSKGNSQRKICLQTTNSKLQTLQTNRLTTGYFNPDDVTGRYSVIANIGSLHVNYFEKYSRS